MVISHLGTREGSKLARSGLCTCLRRGRREDFVFHLNQPGLFSEL